MDKKKVYLAGAISSDPNYKEKFKKAQEELEKLGFIVLSPICIRDDLDYEDYFPICFGMIDVCDFMCVIDFSQGVKRELEHWRFRAKRPVGGKGAFGVYGVDEIRNKYLKEKHGILFDKSGNMCKFGGQLWQKLKMV